LFACECSGARKGHRYIHGIGTTEKNFSIEAWEGNMLTLETERLILRGFITEDWEALNAIVSDPEVTRFMHFALWDEAERREWHACLVHDTNHKEHDAFNWAITLKSDGTLIGWFSTSRIFAECVTSNTASARVMQKSGMTYDGTSFTEDSAGIKVLRYRYIINKQSFDALRSF
jgi:RimJ/RimL family protein N-acetyltransferase